MSRKLSRSVNPGRKLRLPDNRPLPDAVDEFIPLIYHPFGEKVETFSLAELEQNLPTVQAPTSKTNFLSAGEYSLQDSYYEHNEADDGSNVWDEYWFPCESESSGLSQSAASFMSWSDEIEVETTKKLQQMYDDLESFLYDERPAPDDVGPEMLAECRLWKDKFPHLRVVGKAISPPKGFRVSSQPKIIEEVIAIDESESDDETIQVSPKPSFLELDDASERFVYDDVTMGTRCERDSATLAGKVRDCVMEGLFSFVTARIEEGRDGICDPGRNTSRQSALSGKRTLSQSDHRIPRVERSMTASTAKSDVKVTPRVAASSSSPRLVLRAPVNVLFEPSEPRAFRSAAVQGQAKETRARRLHSFAGHDTQPANFPSRQDAILRELRESQLRLSGTQTRTGTGDGIFRDKPRSKTWSGGRHNVLPPLESRRDKGRPDAIERTEKVKSSPRAVSPLRIEVNGTRLARTELKESSLKKYSLLGSTNAKVTSEARKIGPHFSTRQ